MTGDHFDTLQIKPDPAELARMREFIRFNADSHGLEESESFRAQLVATEAVTNAIRHGTRAEDAESPIVVTCHCDGSGFSIEVGDRGRFRHRKPSRAEDTSGRGLGLIERFTSRFDLETSDEGTRLRMLVGAV
jgi:serine/threonine-protein kinase RsbW